MTPNELAKALYTLSPDQLAQIPHETLYAARQYISPKDQGYIAPYEHQAFAREATRENPLMALPIAAGTFAWPLYKALMSPGRSAPSLDQVKGGLLGVGQGLGLLGR